MKLVINIDSPEITPNLEESEVSTENKKELLWNELYQKLFAILKMVKSYLKLPMLFCKRNSNNYKNKFVMGKKD